MNNVIFKYPLDSAQTQHYLPKDAEFLCVQTQFDEPQMWFVIDPSAPDEQRNFLIYNTGEKFIHTSPVKYLGTFQQYQGHYVFHVFELLP